MFKRLLFFLLFKVFICSTLNAQVSSGTAMRAYFDKTDLVKVIRGKRDTTNNPEPERGKLMTFVVPLFGANPLMGFFYGIGGTGAVYFGNPENTTISNFNSAITFTSKNQFIATLKSVIMTKDNNWQFLIDFRYNIFSENTYGLGSDFNQPIRESFSWGYLGVSNGIEGSQPISYKSLRGYFTGVREIKKNFYIGLGLHIDQNYKIVDRLLRLDSGDLNITSHFSYSSIYNFNPDNYKTIGTSFNVIYDSRDHTINPYSGMFLQGSFRSNNEGFGSSQNSHQLYTEARLYKSISKKYPRHLIGFWGIGHFISSGNVPYLHLPANASDMRNRIGRGYVAGRFRGNSWISLDVEYRRPLTSNGLFGMVAFAGITTLSRPEYTITDRSFDKLQLFEAVRPAGGVGGRMMLNRSGRLNLAVDFAVGEKGASGLYIAVGETF